MVKIDGKFHGGVSTLSVPIRKHKSPTGSASKSLVLPRSEKIVTGYSASRRSRDVAEWTWAYATLRVSLAPSAAALAPEPLAAAVWVRFSAPFLRSRWAGSSPIFEREHLVVSELCIAIARSP